MKAQEGRRRRRRRRSCSQADASDRNPKPSRISSSFSANLPYALYLFLVINATFALASNWPARASNRPAKASSSSSQQLADDGKLLVCPEGWQQHSTQCYKFFHQRHSWARARSICERHGAQLALIHDYQQNNFTTQLAALSLSSAAQPQSQAANQAPGDSYQLKGVAQGGAGQQQALYTSDERSYWIGFRAIDRLETNTLESAANTFVSKYIGFWDYEEPRVSQGECVRATVRHESVQPPAQTGSYKLLQGKSSG